MWFTPYGERKLEGAERMAFVDSGGTLLDYLKDAGDDNLFTVPVLEHTNVEDRPFLVLLVTEALIGDSPAPPLRAWNEAVVWEIFAQMKTTIEGNIYARGDVGPRGTLPLFMRQVVLDAVKERTPEKEDRPHMPRVKSTDLETWSGMVDLLAHEILFDTDFLAYGSFADMPPEAAARLKKVLGIDYDYYADAPPYIDEQTKNRLLLLNSRLLNEQKQWYDRFKKTGKLI